MTTRKKRKKTGTRKATAAARPGANAKTAPQPLVLERRLGIESSRAFKTELTALLDGKPDNIAVDATSVELIDTAALQLLVAFSNELRRNAGELEWRGVSDTLRNAAQLLDLESSLALPAEASADNADDDGLCPVF